jgi:hypothetical protein
VNRERDQREQLRVWLTKRVPRGYQVINLGSDVSQSELRQPCNNVVTRV